MSRGIFRACTLRGAEAVVTLTDGLGGRRDVLLGHYKTKALKIEYSRVIAESLANGRQRATVGSVP